MTDQELQNSHTHPTCEPLAIIGMACRYPGEANDLNSFWQLLENEVDAISQMPESRFDIDFFYDPDRKPGKIITREGGFISSIDQFDPTFFGISPREARHIDPQHRLLLKVAWEALETGGQVPKELSGSRTGVFIGIWASEYEAQMFAASDDINFHVMIGGARYPAAGRLSYAFGFQGPSLIVDTACSSSLVAIHLACQSLWFKESDLALAGGVNLILEPEGSIGGSQSGMLSAEARCRFGDVTASGYVRSEGVGMIVIKPLAQAMADNDPIFAVIRGSAINNDGRTGGVLSAPGLEAQLTVMREAFHRAGVQPHQIGYVEAHGTGTPTGDPIELKSLGTILKEGRSEDTPCLIGSVKTNIGHTEPASGVAGIIKAALCLYKRAIPASLHFKEPNPQVPWDELPLKMVTSLQEWPEYASPGFASVNSFGITGTNAHLILQEPPLSNGSELDPPPDDIPYMLPFSAQTPKALEELVQQYLFFIEEHQDTDQFSLRDFGYTLSRRRTHHSHRLVITCTDEDELVESMEAFLRGESYQGIVRGTLQSDEPKTVFVFSGMGPQWWAMGRELLQKEPVFRQAIEACDAYFQPLAGWSLLAELTAAEEESRMHQTDVAQPTNFALQVGLAELWQSWGLTPTAIVGHSAGEVAAAYAAGIFTLSDAVAVIYHRSRLQHLTAGQGKMLAVGLAPHKLEKQLTGREEKVSIAAINSPDSLTLSGDEETLAEIETELKAEGVFVRFLQTEVPYHSPQMDPLKDDLIASLEAVQCHPARIPIYSTVTAQLADTEAYAGPYWWLNVRQPVVFAQTMAQMIADGYHDFLEISPHPVLARSIQECLKAADQSGLVLPSLRRQQPEQTQMLDSLGTLYTSGRPVNWATLYPQGKCLILPTYPWQEQSFWFGHVDFHQERARPSKVYRRQGITPNGKGQLIRLASNPGTSLWQTTISLDSSPFLQDHRVRNTVVFPGAAYIEMVLAAAETAFGTRHNTIAEIEFKEALIVPPQNGRLAQIIFSPQGDSISFQFLSCPQDSDPAHTTWNLHVTGTLHIGQELPAQAWVQPLTPDQRQTQNQRIEPKAGHYQQMEEHLLQYGPTFQAVEKIWHLPQRKGIGLLRLNEQIQEDTGHHLIHPALLDASFQTLLAVAFENTPVASDTVYLPATLAQLYLHATPTSEELWCYVHLHESDSDDTIIGDISLLDPEGKTLLDVKGLCCHKLKRSTEEMRRNWLYTIDWQSKPLQPATPVEPTNWILFANRTPLADQIIQQFTETGGNPVLVFQASEFEQTGPREYKLDPNEPTQWQQLFQSLMAVDDAPTYGGILYLWSLAHQDLTETVDAITKTQRDGVLGVLHLAQALLTHTHQPPPRLWLVTNDTQLVSTQPTSIDIRQAPLWGMGRVMTLEYPELACTCIDLDTTHLNESVQQLSAELQAATPELQITYRQGERYVARLRHHTDQDDVPASVPIQADASYLITGGLGALGLQVAQWLVDKGARHLILTGRRGVTTDVQAQTIAHLTNKGVQVQVITADIAQYEDVKALFDQAAEMPPLHGLIHSAGVLDDGVLHQQSRSRFQKVMAPKIDGAWNLHLLTQDAPLDFFVMFSSLASMLGSLGQSNYAAANAFMDALAHYRQTKGLPALSLNWGPWAEVGMAATGSKRDQARWNKSGVGYITPEEGIRLLDALFVAPGTQAQLGIFPINWSRYIKGTPPLFLEEVAVTTETPPAAAAETQVQFIDTLLAAAVTEQPGLLIDFLHDEIVKVLGLNPSNRIGRRQRLFDLGIDSLVALELRNRIESNLRCSLSATFLFDYPTLEKAAEYIGAQVLALPAYTQNGAAPEQDELESQEALKELEELSEHEAESLLLEELNKIDI